MIWNATFMNRQHSSMSSYYGLWSLCVFLCSSVCFFPFAWFMWCHRYDNDDHSTVGNIRIIKRTNCHNISAALLNTNKPFFYRRILARLKHANSTVNGNKSHGIFPISLEFMFMCWFFLSSFHPLSLDP